MPATCCPTAVPHFRGLFPDWTAPRPVRFFCDGDRARDAPARAIGATWLVAFD